MSHQFLISIVDDDRPFRESMRRLIRSFGYAVDVFPSATAFLASSSLNKTSCLVADVQMPVMNGFELHRHLIDAGQQIPTILMTAYPNDTDRARALNEGIVSYLRKPLDEYDLSWWLSLALRDTKTR